MLHIFLSQTIEKMAKPLHVFTNYSVFFTEACSNLVVIFIVFVVEW